MAFRHMVQIGRVAFISHGKDSGKLCTIVDVIDQNRALIDGPETGVPRQAVKFQRLRLTRFRLKFPHSTSTKVVRKAWTKDKISEQWQETTTAKKLAARKLRSKMNDFDRFKVYKAKQSMNRSIRNVFKKLKGNAKKIAKSKAKKPVKKSDEAKKPVKKTDEAKKPVKKTDEAKKPVKKTDEAKKPVKKTDEAKKPVKKTDEAKKPVKKSEEAKKAIKKAKK